MRAQGSRSETVGVALFVLAHAAWAGMHLLGKQLVADHPALQVAALRGALSIPLVLFAALWTARGLRACVAQQWPLQVARGVLLLVTVTAMTWALRTLPLADAYALTFVAPFFIVLLARGLLRERVGTPQWLAIVFGFCGALVVMRPGVAAVTSLAGLAVLLAALAYASSVVLLRRLVATDSVFAILLWLNVVLAVGAGLLAWPSWQPVAPEDWLRFAALAALGLTGQALATWALQRARAATVAPYEYTALVWAMVLDFALWAVLPRASTVVGAVAIVAAGLYLLRTQASRVDEGPRHVA
jgi:drug/metabolite transporter (DMT)-like permease